jgi:hypothetical protein
MPARLAVLGALAVSVLPLASVEDPCFCLADHDCGFYGCEDDVSSSCDITVTDNGRCQTGTQCTLIAKPCRWIYNISLTTHSVHDIVTYVDGSIRSHSMGTSVNHGPLGFSKDCNQSGSVALGYDGNICVEAIFDCDPCSAAG